MTILELDYRKIIYKEGDKSNMIYFVYKGSVEISRICVEKSNEFEIDESQQIMKSQKIKKRIILATYHKFNIFGEEEIFKD